MKRLNDIDLDGIVGGVSPQGRENILEHANVKAIEHALKNDDGGGSVSLALATTTTTLTAAAVMIV